MGLRLLNCELTPDDIFNEQYLLPEEFRYRHNGLASRVNKMKMVTINYHLCLMRVVCVRLSEIQDRLSCAPYTVTDSEGNSSDHNLVMLDYDIMFSL